MSELPIVCIPCGHFEIEEVPAHVVKHKYIRPLLEVVKCVPLLIPAIGEDFSLKSIADKIDGILLTGAASNVDPSLYGAKREFREIDLDAPRDATCLPLIRDAIELDIPLIGICRGFQEMNVALGGSLHQHVHKLPGKLDHRVNKNLGIQERYEIHQHKIETKPGGIFERMKLPPAFTTNSSHHQGVDRLGTGLFVEGVSEDGLIEAFSVPNKRFILGVQWHPEGDFWLSPISTAIFEEFGKALKKK